MPKIAFMPKHFFVPGLISLMIVFLILNNDYQSVHGQTIGLRPIVRLPQAIKESSGLVVTAPNSLWSHNDSGNANELYCFDTTGNLVRTLTVTNVENIDWEDLAVDDEKNIYIDDAGNNDNDRQDLAIHIISNPDLIAGDFTQAETINFVFEDQTAFPPPQTNRNFDIEALAWKDDSLLLFTKNRSTPQSGYCKQYILPAQPGNFTARLVDSIYLGSTNNEARVTSAVINHQTGEVLLLTASRLLSFTQYLGNNIFAGTMTTYLFNSLPGQVEAIDFISQNRVYVTEEGSSGLGGFLYEAVLPSQTGTVEIDKADAELRLIKQGDRIFLETKNGSEEFDEIQLFDFRGNLLLSETNTGSLSLAGISPGCYIIRCRQEGVPFNIKWVKRN